MWLYKGEKERKSTQRSDSEDTINISINSKLWKGESKLIEVKSKPQTQINDKELKNHQHLREY